MKMRKFCASRRLHLDIRVSRLICTQCLFFARAAITLCFITNVFVRNTLANYSVVLIVDKDNP